MKSDKAIKALLIETKANAVGEEVYYFQATVGTKDREGEIVTVDGWDFKNFLNNPVFMTFHDYEMLPIGKVVELESNDIGFKIGVVFDEEDDFAVKVKRKYDRGFMSAVSVGFIRKETTGKRAGKDWVTTKKELLEISAVPVPGHPDALMIRKGIDGLEDHMGSKAVDFTTSLTLDQARNNLWDRKWTIERALERANDSVIEDADLSREDKLAAIGTNFTQFATAMLGWYGDYITVKEVAAAAGVKMVQPDKPGTADPVSDTGEVGSKAGRAISKKNGERLQTVISGLSDHLTVLQAVLDESSPGEETANGGESNGDGEPAGKAGSESGETAENTAEKGTQGAAIKADLTAILAFVGKEEL